MNWKKYWDRKAENEDLHLQVGRISKGASIREQEFVTTVSHLVALLQLDKEDHLLDVCCGNGMLGSQLANYCMTVTGVDQSEELIKIAVKNFQSDTHRFFVQQADKLYFKNAQLFDKILLHFSFQYFNYLKGREVIRQMLKVAKPGAIIVISDIPDAAKFNIYCKTFKSQVKYHLRQLLGINIMGKFWKREELEKICAELGVKGEFLEQPSPLPYAWYRFDYRIYK